jgi:hypothetical protein
MSIAFWARGWRYHGLAREAGGAMLINRQKAIVTAAILAVIGVGTGISRAQENAGSPLRRVGGHLDLSGVWQAPYVPDMTRDGRGQKGEPNLPFTPAGEQNWKAYDPADGDYTGSCLPFGLSRSMNSPNPMQIMQSATRVAFLFEIMNWFHIVPTDGRAQPKDPDPLWFANRRNDGLQRLDAPRHGRPSAQRRAAPDADLPPHGRGTPRVHHHG